MTTLQKYKNNNYPTIYGGNIFNDLISDFDDIFKTYKTSVPYNVYQKYDKDEQLVATMVEVALAGYNKEDISIKCVGDELQIKVQKAQEVETEGVKCIHNGIARRSIQLEYKLAGIYDKAKIDSTYRNGLLTITIPVSEKENTAIEIRD
jgi:HSP20 family molecular chaperone IbpA